MHNTFVYYLKEALALGLIIFGTLIGLGTVWAWMVLILSL